MSGNKGKVLLQTAKAQAYNEEGSTSVKVRILFDNDSQRTYITNNLQRKLGLTPKKSESIQLSTFGDNKFRKQTCNNVQLVLENSSVEKMDLTALSVPVICSPLPPAVDVDYPHLEGLELADPWNLNSKPLLKKINEVESDASKPTDVSIENNVAEEDQSYVKSSLDPRTPEDECQVKVLGTCWNTETDELYFNFDDLLQYANTLPVTKRSLLKITAKVYDPLGLLSPFTITMKVLFQDVCAVRLDIDWDDTLTREAKERWVLFLNHLKWLNQIRVPRCYFNGHMQPLKIQLHGFNDASKRAYGAVVYTRSVYEDGHIDVRLISSKTKVAPIKQQSIPRLELLGATILVRLINNVKNALPFAK